MSKGETQKRNKTPRSRSRRRFNKNRMSGCARATRRAKRNVDVRMGGGQTLKKYGGVTIDKGIPCYIKYQERGWTGRKGEMWIQSLIWLPQKEADPICIQRKSSGNRYRYNFYLPTIQEDKVTQDAILKIPLHTNIDNDTRAVITDVTHVKGHQFVMSGYKKCNTKDELKDRKKTELFRIKFTTSYISSNNDVKVKAFKQQWNHAATAIEIFTKNAEETYSQKIRAFYKLLYLKEATYNSLLIFENLLDIFVSVHNIFEKDVVLRSKINNVNKKGNRVLGSIVIINNTTVNTRAFKARKKEFRSAKGDIEQGKKLMEINEFLNQIKESDTQVRIHINTTKLFLHEFYDEGGDSKSINKDYRSNEFYEKLNFLLSIYHLILENDTMNDIFTNWQVFAGNEKFHLPVTFIDSQQKVLRDDEETIDEFLKYCMSSYIMDCFDSIQTLMIKIISTEVDKLKAVIRDKGTEIDKQVPNQIIQEMKQSIDSIRSQLQTHGMIAPAVATATPTPTAVKKGNK